MFNAVQDYTLSLLPAKRRKSQSGWLSFNAVCCQHNGESLDTRGRGGVISNPDGGVSYSCFNCKFKTSYIPGRPLSFKFRKLLRWLGADQNEVQRLVIEAVRIKDLIEPADVKEPEEKIEFEIRELPKEAKSFWALAEFYRLADYNNLPTLFSDSVNYITRDRGLNAQKYDFYWTPEVEHKLSHRVIIPFKYKQGIVGYTARALVDGIKPKYYSNHPSDFVFNLDEQLPNNKFVIVCEGPIDAMSIDGISVQGNQISEQQAELIESLGKRVIVVPDWDEPGKQMIDHAIEYGWDVSFPVWRETCKDINSAVQKYGKLFVLKAILTAAETNPLKIKLMKNK
jgi:5S rRNA maturation endonuclease (ribonuclease M5)